MEDASGEAVGGRGRSGKGGSPVMLLGDMNSVPLADSDRLLHALRPDHGRPNHGGPELSEALSRKFLNGNTVGR